MRVREHDRARVKPLKFPQPIEAAIDHYVRAAVGHKQRCMHAMPSRARLDLAACAEERQFHQESLVFFADWCAIYLRTSITRQDFWPVASFIVQSRNPSPRINHVSWGRLEVEGRPEPYKDAKLFPGGSREWNWRETKTSHRPGIQIADVQELLEHGSKVVVLSRGMAECLHVPRDTLDFLKERQIAVHVLPTQHAVALYNKLAQTEAVGGLFHTTC
jgi:hypothetical protein